MDRALATLFRQANAGGDRSGKLIESPHTKYLFKIALHTCNASVVAPRTIRELIRHRIKSGLLPRTHTIELWQGGASFGHICDGCGADIASNDPMCLLCGEDWSLTRLHLNCFQVWDSETIVEPGTTQKM